jgi:NTE family protein
MASADRIVDETDPDDMGSGSVALVLGSGSARGLAHIGVLKVFEREGLPIDLIAGTSIGALVGGAYAAGISAKEIEAIALSTNIGKLVSLIDIARPTTAMVNGRKVEAFIRNVVGDATFADTRIPFACVAVDVANEREIVLREGDLASAIRASISTPVIFAPVERDGRLLVDGGVLNSVPVDVAKDMGADTVVAVTTLGVPRCRVPIYFNGPYDESAAAGTIVSTGFAEIVYSRAISLVMDRLRSPSVFRLAAGSLDLMQRELSETRLKDADLVIAPLIDGAAYYSFYEAERMIAAGEEAAEAAVADIRTLLAARQVT